jgi:putative redox protein
MSKKTTFRNAQGDLHAASLELPDGFASSFAIFAHCFTCSKDAAAASRIGRSLAGTIEP